MLFYTIQYSKTQRDRINEVTSWPYYKTWKAPQLVPDGAIIGIGANLSYEYAESCFKRFASRVKLPPHRVEHVERGCTPYRRPPYSLVSDGFVALGDSACLTNPMTGEGVSAHWLEAEIAADVAAQAMNNGLYPSREALWPINVRYYEAQGAEFAQTLSMLAGAVDCSPEENDYEFRKSIIFTDGDEDAEAGLIGKLIKGAVTGRLKFKTLKNLLSAAGTGGKILKHYKAYPKDPGGYEEWARKADMLWSKTRDMASDAEEDSKSLGL